MMEKVRTALIGFGGMGSKYAKMIYDGEVDGMVLTGVCCRNARGQETLRRDYAGVSIYQNVEDALAHQEEFDAALVVTPHTSHVEIGLQMVSAGKHILLDKPAGVSTKEVKTLVQAAREAGVSFGMMFNVRMNPAFRKAKELLEAEELGTIERAVWICNTWYRTPAYHHSAPWRSSWNGERGGLLINQSQHYLDIWQWLLGMPDQVLASLEYGRYNDFLVDDSADIQFFYQNGIHGTLITASGEAPGVNRLEIWGTKGRLCIEDTSRVMLDENEMSTEEFAKVNTEIYASLPHHLREIPVGQEPCGYQKVLTNFADHLRKGTPLLADGGEGLKSVELMNGAYLSSWLEKKMDLPVDEELYLEKLQEKMDQEKKLQERERGVSDCHGRIQKSGACFSAGV